MTDCCTQEQLQVLFPEQESLGRVNTIAPINTRTTVPRARFIRTGQYHCTNKSKYSTSSVMYFRDKLSVK